MKYLLLFSCLFTGLACKAQTADTALIRQHLAAITKTPQYRNHRNVEQLNRTASYIQQVFGLYSDSVTIQEYEVKGKIYKNVICSFGKQNARRVVIGAHYDVCGDQEGADDNASGVTGLLELARMLKEKPLKYRVDLVAYSLEEPPYFDTEQMGSYVHARYLADHKVDVYGMVSLEMIGFYADHKHSQSYPVNALSLIYGKKGNFITLVKTFHQGKFARQFTRKFRKSHALRTKKFTGPKSLVGIDLSDHANYWHFGFSALMVTDTSFYRNANYHEAGDTLETLDLYRMGKVIDGVYHALTHLH